MSIQNLRNGLARADADDWAEGRLAYGRYNQVMRWFAEAYDAPLDRTVAAFVALSPNNDYYSNLRSLASCLAWRSEDPERIIVSTYNHCKLRALSYLSGEVVFMDTVKGPKTRAFYSNVLDPSDPYPVTVDGHISAIWQGKNLTMRNALINKRTYETIAEAMRELSAEAGLLPNQAQAAMWFGRKRTQGIVYKAQLDMFYDMSDKWRTLVEPIDAPPYPLKARS